MQQLIAYLKQHGVEVHSNTDTHIKVIGVICFQGQAYKVPQDIPANMQAVRNWLGY